MKKAWVENGNIRDVCPGNPLELYHPDIAKFYETDVPDDAQNGWIFENGQWVVPPVIAPQPTPEPSPVYPKVGPIAFQMLFTPAEMIAADELKATDKVLASFWKLIDDPRTDVVDLGLESVQNAITYTLDAVKNHGVDVDVPVRLAAILSGVLK